jgi:hypothetical protein
LLDPVRSRLVSANVTIVAVAIGIAFGSQWRGVLFPDVAASDRSR